MIQTLKQKIAPSFDLIERTIVIKEQKLTLFFISSLSDNNLIADLIDGITITMINDAPLVFYPGGVSSTNNEEQAIQALLSGQCIVILNDDSTFYLIESRHYPSRNSNEVSIEKSVRGSHDAFVENIIFNVGLIRRRIRSKQLTFQISQSGYLSNNDIVLCYINDLVDQNLLNKTMERLKHLKPIEIMNEKQFIEAFYDTSFNPYPHVRYSERADLCAIHLLQGYIVILVDNIPCSIIIPTTFFEQSKQMEEFTQTPMIAIFTRITKLIAIFVSIYLMPLWIALVIDQIPTLMNLKIGEIKPIQFGVGIILAELIVEWIRLALIYTPNMLSSIMSFIAIFILGESAIELKAYTKEILVMIALSNITTLLTPSYELSLANKFFRIVISIFSLLFGVCGLCIASLIHFSILLSTKTYHYPYLYPLIPFSYREFKRIFIGSPTQLQKK